MAGVFPLRDGAFDRLSTHAVVSPRFTMPSTVGYVADIETRDYYLSEVSIMAREYIAKQGEKVPARKDIARDPFLALRDRVDRIIDEFSGGLGLWPASWDVRPMEWRMGAFMPTVDIKDRDNEIEIDAELPGVSEKDVELSLSGDSLIIKGEKKHETEEQEKGYYRAERAYGVFERAIPLPVDVDREKVEATFKNGVLSICLPKTKEAIEHIKKIPIRA